MITVAKVEYERSFPTCDLDYFYLPPQNSAVLLLKAMKQPAPPEKLLILCFS